MKNLIKNGSVLNREEQKAINGGFGEVRCDRPYIVMDPNGDGTYSPSHQCPAGYVYDEARDLCCQA